MNSVWIYHRRALVALATYLAFVTIQAHWTDGSAPSRAGFTENKGQVIDQHGIPNPAVLFLQQGSRFNVQLRSSGFSYDLYRAEPEKQVSAVLPIRHGGKAGELAALLVKRHRIDFDLEGLEPVHGMVASARTGHLRNYYTTGTPKEGVVGVRQFNRVIYTGVYPKIDLEFVVDTDGGFKYNFIVHPGGDVSAIRLRVNGALFERMDSTTIRFHTLFGPFEERIPACIWRTDGDEGPAQVTWTRGADGVFGFAQSTTTIPEGAELVIDPVPDLVWGTYFGGEWQDLVDGMDVNPNGEPFITGETASATNVATVGAYQDSLGSPGDWDGFLARFDAAGACQWATYIGGSGMDYCSEIAVDENSYSHVTGISNSPGLATPDAHQSEPAGMEDVLIAKFSPTGSLVWLTYYGGAMVDEGVGIDLDQNGAIYVGGYSGSPDGISTPPDAFQITKGAYDDWFLARFTSDGDLVWGTYIGYVADEAGGWLTVGSDGRVYICGQGSTGATVGTYDWSLNGQSDATLICFTPGGQRIWGTYFGGPGFEWCVGVCLDDLGNVFLLGYVDEWWLEDLVTPGAFLSEGCIHNSPFLAKFDHQGQRLWSTYFGGPDHCVNPRDIAPDGAGGIYISGESDNDNTYVSIATPDAYQTEPHTPVDCVLGRFNGDGQELWMTYYGGETIAEYGKTLGSLGTEGVFLAGATMSMTGIATPQAYQTILGNPALINAGFLSRFSNYPLSVEETTGREYGRFYPNPTMGSFSIPTSGIERILIYDAAGRVVRSSSTAGQALVQVEGLGPGIYAVYLSGKGAFRCERIVILEAKE